MSNAFCRLCAAQRLEPLLDLGSMPVAHRLLESADSAEECFPFALAVCAECGLVQIEKPIDPERLYSGYNYNFSSWKFEPHLEAELQTIVERIAPDSVLEIGCNDGRFLEALRARGVARCAGIEPNPAPAALARERGLDVYGGYASPELVAQIVAERGTFDLVVARQVLEHVHDPVGFLGAARAALVPGGYLFVDIPEFGPARALGDCSVLWEEHVSYFTDATLRAAVRRAGFEPTWSARYDFSGTTLAALAKSGERAIAGALEDDLAVELAATRAFPRRVGEYRERLRAVLARARSLGVRVVLYGVGVRACTAVNGLDLGASFDLVLDDQPERQGKFMPGTRLPIVAPQTLAASRGPVLCALAVNNENEARVRARLDGILGAQVRYLSICGPANVWDELDRAERCTWAAA